MRAEQQTMRCSWSTSIEEPVVRASSRLTLGEVLLEVLDAHRARERFEAAIAVFDARRDLRAVGHVGA